jgi:hypothetical protein
MARSECDTAFVIIVSPIDFCKKKKKRFQNIFLHDEPTLNKFG